MTVKTKSQSEKSEFMSHPISNYWKQISEIQEKFGISNPEARRYYNENVKKKTKKNSQPTKTFPVKNYDTTPEEQPSIGAISLEELLPVVKNYVRRCGNIEVAKMLLNFVDECKRM